jgi:xylulokinase
MAEADVPVDNIVGVGCTAQWSGTVAASEDGTPLRPAVIWMDSRGSAAIRKQASGAVNVLGYDIRKIQRWIRLTGGAPGHSGKDPLAFCGYATQNRRSIEPRSSSWSRWIG